MTTKTGKPCKKCGTSERYSNGACKRCKILYNQQYRKENPEKRRASNAHWKHENAGRNRDNARRWRQENPERDKENKRLYAQSRPPAIRKAQANYRRNHPEVDRRRYRRWLANNLDKHAARQQRRRARKAAAPGDYTAEEFRQLCERYDNRCLACGRNDVKLTFDHVVPLSMGGSNDIANGQPLCASCNSSKGTKTIDYRTKPMKKRRWLQPSLFNRRADD